MAHLTNFSFDFLWNFHRRCLWTSSIPWCKKVKMIKNSNQGGPCLNLKQLIVQIEFSKELNSLQCHRFSLHHWSFALPCLVLASAVTEVCSKALTDTWVGKNQVDWVFSFWWHGKSASMPHRKIYYLSESVEISCPHLKSFLSFFVSQNLAQLQKTSNGNGIMAGASRENWREEGK